MPGNGPTTHGSDDNNPCPCDGCFYLDRCTKEEIACLYYLKYVFKGDGRSHVWLKKRHLTREPSHEIFKRAFNST